MKKIFVAVTIIILSALFLSQVAGATPPGGNETITRQAEHGLGDGQDKWRSAAEGGKTTLLKKGESLILPFELAHSGMNPSVFIRYSNDDIAPLDVLRILLDGNEVASITGIDTGTNTGSGGGWNVFTASSPIVFSEAIESGSHQWEIQIIEADQYGIEIDSITLQYTISLSSEPSMELTPEFRSALLSDRNICLDLLVDGGQIGVSAFEFEILFSKHVSIESSQVTLGPFLESTGKSSVEAGPITDDGILSYGVASSGTQPAPIGVGVGSTLCFTLEQAGEATATLTSGHLVSKEGNVIPVASLNSASFTIVNDCFAADISCDGVVNEDDIALMNSNFGKSQEEPEFKPQFDLNQNGRVGVEDLQLIIAELGWTAE